MTDKRKETGRAAEQAVADYLESLKFTILERNYRKRYGEMDLIARKENCLHFIEIKSRHPRSGIPIWESWDEQQKGRFISLAETYTAENEHFLRDGMEISFDFAAVQLDEAGNVESINIIYDAFRPGSSTPSDRF